jgi:adenylosuccinate synthase
MAGEIEQKDRERGKEYGASTGRPRRCGWFDAVAVRYATRVNGFDAIALTKLDVLDGLPEIPVCTAYRHAGETIHEFPSDGSVLEACEPVYETLPGWNEPTAGMREFKQLPEAARRYVDRLAELSGCPIGIISTGPDRDHTIRRSQSPIASWFD